MPAQLLLVNPSAPRSRLRRPVAGFSSSMHRPVMRSGVRLPKPVDVPSSPRSNGEAKMAKKKQKSRRRRAASPAQIAARKKFVEMVRSGKFKKGKKKAKKKAAAKKRAAKKAAHKVARKHRDNPARKHKRRHAKKHAKHRDNPARKHKRRRSRRSRRARHNPLHGFMSRYNPRGKAGTMSGKREQKMAEALAQEAYQAEQLREAGVRGGKKPQSRFRRGSRLAAMSPADRRAYMRRAKARKKNRKKIADVRSRIKKINKSLASAKASKRSTRVLRARKTALSLNRAGLSGTISGSDARMLKASGLMQVRNNPSFGEVFASLKALVPQLGAHAVGLAGAAYAGQMLGDRICKMLTPKDKGTPTEGVSGFICKNSATIGTVGVAIAAYEALKHMSPKTRPFAGAVLMGGVAAAFVHAAARMKTGTDGTSNLGKDIGLPLSLAGFVDIGGRALAVDGLGDYMALSGNTLTGSTLGDYMALSGNTLTGSSLGEYMALSGNTLTGSSLGEIGQMSEGRQGARALNSPGDVPVEDFLEDDEEDEGSLSGSIFDD